MKNKQKLNSLLFTLIMLTVFCFSTHLFSDGYYVRMVYETSKAGTFMRSEEVYESGDYKIVFVTSPENFVWVRLKDKYYIGDSNVLLRSFQIKDLADIAYEYVKAKRLDITKDGVYKFNEESFSLEIFVVSGEIMRVVRTVADVTTTMYINKFPKQFDIRSLLAKYKFVDDTPFPEEIYSLSKFFLWATTSQGKDLIRISGYDKNGKVLELEINKTSGDFKVGNYYIKILKASEATAREIKNALRNY
ncbi:hypothetical protein SAMN04488510_1173 [Fervidobacterium changbaicum]|uniref:DUF4340 domain-containing protein n=3 Tax=Fervidobacteriaceae TaxID=1643950 RepID=A0AAI8CNG8_FERIS|nr:MULTISPECIES: hypothetical protein [Fervidobacterium]AMW33708.2 hypothetical protein NA23_04700 [Fervidobacterium islandicum]SDH50191.1 hypothetical protein SAMN04488510_1173 [Fervidobacterium changbaicum]